MLKVNEKWFGMIVAIVVCLAFVGLAQADWLEQAKLLASDGAAEDRFGGSSISTDYAIVGARKDDDNGTNSGSAYIFKRSDVPNDPNWYEQAKLTASDGAAGDTFGSDVCISGDYAIVEAEQDDDRGTNSGSAYIFKRRGTSWIQVAKLLASDGAAGDAFGSSSISTDYTIFVSAEQDDENGTNSGSVYVFKRVCPTADLSGDCFVDFVDLAIVCGQWMQGN